MRGFTLLLRDDVRDDDVWGCYDDDDSDIWIIWSQNEYKRRICSGYGMWFNNEME